MSDSVLQLISRLRKNKVSLRLEGEKLKISAPPGALDNATKNALKTHKAEIIEFLRASSTSSQVKTISPAVRGEEVPQSIGQERLWFLHQMSPSASYNMTHALMLHGQLNIEYLQQAFQFLVDRHEILRTHFSANENGKGIQIINDTTHISVPLIDLSELGEPQQFAKTQEIVLRETQQAFDLNHAPLMRVKILRRAEEEHLLVFCMHHIISDGWSLGVLVNDVMQCYVKLKHHLTVDLPPLAIQYADYAVWQRRIMEEEYAKKHLVFWQKELADVSDLLALPTDKQRPQQQSFRGDAVHFSFSAKETIALKRFSQQQDITLFMLLLAGFQILLGRLAQQEDLTIGIPIAGRDNPQSHSLIGFFINVLVLRGNMRGNPTVAEYLHRVRKSTLGAFENQDVPMEEVLRNLPLRRNAAFNPGAQVGFSWQAGLGAQLSKDVLEVVESLSVESFDVPHSAIIQDLTLSLWDGADGIEGRLEYATDLFHRETIAMWVNCYRYLLSGIAEHPEESIHNLELLPEEEMLDRLGFDCLDVEHFLPLTPMQRDIYLDASINPNSLQNSMGYVVPLHGEANLVRWQQALDNLTEQVPMLRTEYVSVDLALGGNVYQIIKKHDHHQLKVIDWRNEDWDEDELQQQLKRLIIHPYRLREDSLIKHFLILTSNDQYRVVAATHHINSDGMGMAAHARKWLAHYEVLSGTRVDIPGNAENFQIHVSSSRRQADRGGILAYWRERFRDTEPLVFNTTVKSKELSHSSSAISRKEFLSANHITLLKSFCRRQRVVPALYFKALYAYLLKHYCRAVADFDIVEFNAGRNSSNMYDCGIFYQQQPFVLTKECLNGNNKFVDLLAYAKKFQKESKSFRPLSTSKKISLNKPGPLIFTYNYYHFEQSGSFEGVDVTAQIFPPVLDQSVQFVVNQNGNNINLNLDYNEAHFQDYNFLDRVVYLSEQVLDNSDVSLAELELVLPREREVLLARNSAVQRILPAGYSGNADCVQKLFEKQVKLTPDTCALQFQSHSCTYAELNKRANQLAHYLRSVGLERNQIVAICLPRSVEMIVAVLGIMKAGAAYLPLDPDYPQQRLSYILKDSRASALIFSHYKNKNIDTTQTSFPDLLVNIEEHAERIAQFSITDPQHINERDDLIYVIYTSGSTGQPKGVALKHRGELNLLNWYGREFEINAASRVMMLSAFGFDLTQKNLLAPLVGGGTLILPEGELIDSQLILEQINRFQATLVNCAPSVFYPLLELSSEDQYASLSCLITVIFGGEAIHKRRLTAWLNHENCMAEVVNNYGPTECTDIAAYYRLPKEEIETIDTIPVGSANDNVALYLVNDDNQMLPAGLVGELCVAGEGVGAGYLYRDQLNQSSFEINPFLDQIELKNTLFPQSLERWYRTGDLMRYFPDGNLEFIGRKDFQVKVRGLRVEPGEIEWALLQSTLIASAQVLADQDRLIAFVVPSAATDQQKMKEWNWRQHLRNYIPDTMLPSSVQVLDAWPLTPNGKIDRKALPGLISDRQKYNAPGSAIEAALCEIWAQVLGLEKVGIEDNFFEIGGHSLLATRIISQCRQRFNVDVPLRQLFKSPTISTLASLIEKGQAQMVAPPIEKAPEGVPIPLSFAQQRLWFIDQMNPGNVAYLMPGAFKISGSLKPEKLLSALHQVVERHEVLRSNIVNRDGEGWQEVFPADHWQAECIDLSNELEKDQRIAELIKLNSNTSLNLASDPLFKVTLIKLTESEWVLLSCMHHIIGDGLSINILLMDLAHYYTEGLNTGLEELPVQYSDYSLWQRNWLQGHALEEHIQFWKQYLHGAPAVLNLPADRPRPKVQNFEGENYLFNIDASLTNKINAIAQTNQLTVFMVLLGAYNILLSRYSGQKDICVGLPVAGRNYFPTENMIGLFLNAIVVRTQFEGNARLTEYYQDLKENILSCMSHQDLPAEVLLEQLKIERSLSHAPVAQLGFQLQKFAEVGELPAFEGLELEALPLGRVSSKYDMTFILREEKEGLSGIVEYSTALFDVSTIARFVEHYINLLSQITISFEQRLDSLSLAVGNQLALALPGAEEAEQIVRLTTMQRDLVLLNRANAETLENCFGSALIFPDKIDGQRLYEALEMLAQKNSILRSRIVLADQPWLNDAYRLVFNDLQVLWRENVDAIIKSEDELRTYARDFIFQPYSFSEPLIRFELLHQDKYSYLLIAAHHAALDGMGVASMTASLMEVYHGLLDGKDVALPEEYFPIYLEKESSQTDTPEAIHYWREKLGSTAGLSQWKSPSSILVSNENSQKFINQIKRHSLTLDDAHWFAVRKYCRQQRITPALYFKGIFGLLIKLYCRPDENFSISELSSQLLGMRLNAAGCHIQRRPFIFDLRLMEGEQSIADFFAELRVEQRGLNRTGLHTSIMTQKYLLPDSRLHFMYNYYHFTREFEVSGHHYNPILFHNDVEQVHLIVNFEAGKLHLGLHYPQDSFDDYCFIERLECISQQIVNNLADSRVQVASYLNELDFILQMEKNIVVEAFTGKQKDISACKPLNQQVREALIRAGTSVAIKQGEHSLSYQELLQQSDSLAEQLLARGIGKGSLIAICLPRSLMLMPVLIAVVKIGACYVPIDSSYPSKRIQYIIADSGAEILLTSSQIKPLLPEITIPYLFIGSAIDTSGENHTQPLSTHFEDLLYVIYTSGSTGQPKGAAVKQRGVINLLEWYRSEFAFNRQSRHLVMSAFGFDLTQKNLWAPILTGGTIYFPEDDHYHSLHLLRQIENEKITVINCAPSVFYGILDACEGDYRALCSLRYVILGGEAIVVDRIRKWLTSEHCHAQLVNSYGPTECTDIAAFYRLENFHRKTVPLGHPNTNVNLHLVNENGQQLPPGMVGELCISGESLGAGYLNKPELTEKAFQAVPMAIHGTYKYWYRTGDLMCLLPNGDLEFVGRKDFQVKLRGLRIELQEVETAIREQVGVEDCLVLIDRRPLTQQEENVEELEQLVAYVVGADILREYHWQHRLAQHLPLHMIPSQVMILERWPLTANGKINREVLPKIEEVCKTAFVSPRNETEEVLASIWEEILGLNRVGIWDNFFQVGGNSMLAVRIASRMEKQFGYSFPLSMLFSAQNIAELARLIEGQLHLENWSPLVLIKTAEQDEGESPLPPLYLIHPVGGTILCYQQLAETMHALEPNRAIYGLQSSGMLPEQEVLNRFELMATYYLEAIQSKQAKGPYYIAGQSLGGNIAWEMAQQLRAQGCDVALLGLIDSFVPQKIPAAYRARDMLTLLREQFGNTIELDWVQLREENTDKQIEIFCQAAQQQGLINAELDLEQVKRMAIVMQANVEALLAYQAQTCQVNLIHVRATRNPNGDSSVGWAELTTGSFEAVNIDAGHEDILEARHAKELARLLMLPDKT